MRVFLSSTAEDLAEYREVADDTLLRLQQQSVVMERFGPRSGIPVDECERLAASCDVLICVVAHRYGFVPEPGRGSITRREVEAARAAEKRIYAWIVADYHPWPHPKESDRLNDPAVLADPARIAEITASLQGLHLFKQWLRDTFVCEDFTTPDDLGRKIAIALKATDTGAVATAAAPARRAEIRVVHALQPAPHFRGRDDVVAEIGRWVTDLTSPDRVWSLVAAGGTGKTAIVERVVRAMEPGDASVLVWSFYENPNADAFLRECNHLFLGEGDDAPGGGRLERLQRSLRDGQPHLLVLDGLERVQEEAGPRTTRGELTDQALRLLLRSVAAGLGRTRALVTSRFPLVDLRDWERTGYRETRLDDLTPDAAVAVLRGWGVIGDEAALREAAAPFGYHALSVAVIGSYLQSFERGRIEGVARFDLDTVQADDPKAARLTRVLASYAERLPAEERDLLVRLSAFPRGIPLDLLHVLIDAGGDVAGLLVRARPRLAQLLERLRIRGLVFPYGTNETAIWTAHPFLREWFRDLLGAGVADVHAAVADSLGTTLERRPRSYPTDDTVLDRYEQLIEATRLAGRIQEAFDLYWYGLGNYRNLKRLGEYDRARRILSAFSTTGAAEDLAPTLSAHERGLLVTDLGLASERLGRLRDARSLFAFTRQLSAHALSLSIADQNACWNAVSLGRLPDARHLAQSALDAADNDQSRKNSYANRATAAGLLGDIDAADADFDAAAALEKRPLFSLRGAQHARHLIDSGHLDRARSLCDDAIAMAERYGWHEEHPRFRLLLARIDLEEARDPTVHLNAVRDWSARTGDLEPIVETHLLTARHLLTVGNHQHALADAETGLLQATACGYGLLHIDLLLTVARIRLVWPAPAEAVKAAREALDLATAPDCRYAWGEADAAQVWGEAYVATREPQLARRAFTHALEVRRRIRHPHTDETERWLAQIVAS